MADWSKLPYDLLGEIALKLDSVEETIYFTAVCRSWHCVYSMVKKQWTAKPARMPWLMLPENTKDNPNFFRKVFCPNKRRYYELELPETFGGRCWGSSCGWVVSLDLNLELYLFNPLTRTRICLPPQSTVPNRMEGYKDFHWMRKCFVDKMLVFINDDDNIVVTLHVDFQGRIAYARPGDQAWTSIITPQIHGIRAHDIARWGSQILILYNDGSLGCCDMSAFRNPEPVTVMEYLPAPLELSETFEFLHQNLHRVYLLESFGDLVMVLRYKEQVVDLINSDEWGFQEWEPDWILNIDYRTVNFKVYKLNFDVNHWEEVQDLGNVALFLGNNYSMSVHALGTNNCKRNCIYFTDDEWKFWGFPELQGGNDMGIFHKENRKIETIYKVDDTTSDFRTALWFLPKF